jgi:hypothetical protein
MDAGHTRRRLRRQASEHTGAVDPQGREHLEVGLDAGAAPAVRPGHGQGDRPENVSMLHGLERGDPGGSRSSAFSEVIKDPAVARGAAARTIDPPLAWSFAESGSRL